MADPTPLQAQGYGLQRNYAAAEQAIRADTRLTPEARNEDIRRLHAQTQAELDALRAKGDTQKDARIRELRLDLTSRSVLEGVDPSLTISYRDAFERAARLQDEPEAVALMAQASDSRDIPLERAILSRAYDQRWSEAINTYTAAHPVFLDRAEELWSLTNPVAFSTFVQSTWDDGLAFRLPDPTVVTNFAPTPTVPPLRGRGR
ncbi:hypothetical protein ACMA46_11825 [Clavibacter sp. Sh2141]|uniref:hypothetical protein n=1 Tax=Clavibacter sp. Sh2141 TaxID=3395374 RepID=UPI0039BCF727